MERFKTFVKGAFSYPRQLLSTHPATIVSIIAASILFSIYSFIEIDYTRSKNIEKPLDILLHICIAIVFFAVFSLCLESIRPRWSKIIKAVILAVFGLISLFMSFILSDYIKGSRSVLSGKMMMIRERAGIYTIFLHIAGLLALALLLALYFSYSHDVHQRFNDHIMNANAKMFFTAIIYGVIQMGVLFLTIIVSVLLYDNAFEYMFPILILINGLFYVPAVICAYIRQNEKANMFMQVLVRYVMLINILIAYAIIYIYILKLIITADVPSNSVFAILTALFVVSMYITYMCTTFENKGFLQKFAYNAPLIFAPFILMQCYTVFVRIGQYGLTPMRYFGIAFIVFEITYIVYYTICLKKEKEIMGRNILLVMGVFVIIAIFMPGVSARSLSTTLARRALSSYIEKSNAGVQMSDREYVRANAAYGFLRGDDFGTGRLQQYFPGFDEDAIAGLKEKAIASSKVLNKEERASSKDSGYPMSSWYSADLFSDYSKDGVIDVSDYKKMIYVYVTDTDNVTDSAVDTTKLSINVDESGESDKEMMSVDLSKFINEYNRLSEDKETGVIDYDEFRNRVHQMGVIEVNENARLYITDADITRNAKLETVHVDIHGYLLVK